MENLKTVLITGATGGIGKATATALADMGWQVVVHGRNPAKTDAVCREIQENTGNKNVEALVGDLSLMSGVKRVAETFIRRYPRLDVLINNAGGIMDNKRRETTENIEITLALNLLAPFLLSQLLLDSLKKSEDGRIVNVSSNSHKLNAKPDFTDIELKNNYHPLTAYGNAKLFLIWITRMLAERLGRDGNQPISVNSLHPGAVATGFGVDSDLGGMLNFFGKLARPFFKSPQQGAETVIYLATSEDVQDISGKYFERKRITRVSERYYSLENEALIRAYCEEKTNQWI